MFFCCAAEIVASQGWKAGARAACASCWPAGFSPSCSRPLSPADCISTVAVSLRQPPRAAGRNKARMRTRSFVASSRPASPPSTFAPGGAASASIRSPNPKFFFPRISETRIPSSASRALASQAEESAATARRCGARIASSKSLLEDNCRRKSSSICSVGPPPSERRRLLLGLRALRCFPCRWPGLLGVLELPAPPSASSGAAAAAAVSSSPPAAAAAPPASSSPSPPAPLLLETSPSAASRSPSEAGAIAGLRMASSKWL